MLFPNTVEPENCTDMIDVRREIDSIDEAIIAALGKRFEYVKSAAKFKTSATSVRAPQRFEAMLAQRRQWAEAQDLNPDVIEKMYRDLVGYFIEEEMSKWRKD